VPRTVADNLRELRRELDLRQEDVAALAGVRQAQYSKWETGFAVPKPASLLRLALAFGVNVDRLVSGLNPEYDRKWGRPSKAPPGALAARGSRARSG
jgi:transcriptional regulator with XRE-family HTH domain